MKILAAFSVRLDSSLSRFSCSVSMVLASITTTSCWMYVCSGYLSAFDMSTKPLKNSFQWYTMLNSVTVASTGTASGMNSFTSMYHGPAPSTSAASSSSFGRLRK
ncbi:hypothetical protein D3C73_1382230 [compost metagenome]